MNRTLYMVSPEWSAKSSPLEHSWSGFLNVDQFRWMIRRDLQEQLALAVQELGGRHVRAVGMFDDEMRFWSQGPGDWAAKTRTKGFNFHIIDYVMDSLLDAGLAPMFTTCFTPSEWARGDRTCFSTRSHVGPPKDMAQWENAVRRSVAHARNRYGLETLKNWYFEVWNEPNLAGFFDGTKEEFFELWERTFHAIKSVDSGLRVGGPSTARAEWIEEFLNWTAQKKCSPDYIITHVYNNDSESGALSPFDGPQEERANRSPHFASRVIRGTRHLLDAAGYRGEVHWNEWGRTWHPTDSARESSNEAAWLVKTMSEVSHCADRFAYWCLSDIYDQVGYTSSAFEGHYGMMNLHGLRKPNWHAHQLLSRLEKQRLPCHFSLNDGCSGVIVTRGPKRWAALFFAHEPVEDYAPETRSFGFLCPEGSCRKQIKITRLNSRENNVLAHWRDLGSPSYPSRSEIQEMKSGNEVQFNQVVLADESKCIRFEMETPGLALIEGEIY